MNCGENNLLRDFNQLPENAKEREGEGKRSEGSSSSSEEEDEVIELEKFDFLSLLILCIHSFIHQLI
jgi:hypothetical protein